MSTYTGKWPQGSQRNEAEIRVTVDGQPLEALSLEMPGSGNTFGWGSFSRWVDEKLLAYSLLLHELHNVMGQPMSEARVAAIALTDPFMKDYVARFDKEWTLTSEQISSWIEKQHGDIWAGIVAHKATM